MFRRVDEQPAAGASRLSFWSVTLCVYLKKTVGSDGVFGHAIRAHLMMHSKKPFFVKIGGTDGEKNIIR